MRNGLILGGFAAALSVAALVVAVIALVNSTAGPPEIVDAPWTLLSSSEVEPRVSDRPGFTVDMVQQALDRYDQEGREATLAYYNSPESIVGDWYVFIFDENDLRIAHRNPATFGQDLKGGLGVDATGYRFGDVMVAATEEGRWVDYLFLNPNTGNQEFKHAWVVRHDGLLFGSGWYQVLPSSPLEVTKSQPAEYTVAFVDRAILYYRAHGRAGAVQYYNTPASADKAWYVFIVDENEELIAHRDPSLLGKHIDEVGSSIEGEKFSELEVTEAGRWVDYHFVNPVTGNDGIKHSWVVRHDGLIIGSGWYE